MLVIWVHVALLAVCIIGAAVSKANRRRAEAAEEEARRRAQWARADRAREARQAAQEKREAEKEAAERRKAEREQVQAVKREIAAQRRAEREARQAAAHAAKVARAAELAELAERRLQAEKEAAALRRQAAQAAPVEAGRVDPSSVACGDSFPPGGSLDGADREPTEAAPVEAGRVAPSSVACGDSFPPGGSLDGADVEPTEAAPVEPVKADSEPTEPDREPTEADGMSLDAFAELVRPRPFAGHTVAFTGRVYSRKGEHVPRADLVELVRDLGGRAFEKGMPAGTTLLVVGERPGMKKLDQADEWIGQVRKITPAQFWNMIQTA